MFRQTVQMLAASYSKQIIFDVYLGHYAQFFQGFVWIEAIWSFAMLLVGIAAQVYCVKAVLRWRSFYASVKVLSLAWLAVCGLPWLWATLEPIAFNLTLDVRGLQRQACEDIIHGTFQGLHAVLALVNPSIANVVENIFNDLGTPWIAQLGTGVCNKPAQALTQTLSDGLIGLDLDQGQVKNVKYALQLIFLERTWEGFFGICYISKSRLLALFPTLLGLMFGVLQGVSIVRTIVPYSRVPGLLLLCSIGFTSPFVIVLAVSANAILGNVWLLLGLLFALAALIVCNVPWDVFGLHLREYWTLMTPISHETLAQGNKYRYWLTNAFFMLAGIFIIIGLLLSDVVRSKLEWQGESLVELLHDQSFRYQVFEQLKVIVLNYFVMAWTIKAITQVIFTDWVLHLVLVVDEAGLSSQSSTKRRVFREHNFKNQKQKILRELDDAF